MDNRRSPLHTATITGCRTQNDSYQATSGTPADLDILNNDKVYFADTDVTDQVALEVDINSLVSSTEGITLDKTQRRLITAFYGWDCDR